MKCNASVQPWTRYDEAQRMVEAGLDLVIDSQSDVWLIEINSRPRGRMEVLAST